jgi:2-oxoisovalerate dehydrogenase E2 component (dihydrolipoyl transacylase)
MSSREFCMPDLGEGLTESELVSWEVAEGDTVELNQIIAEVETEKALVQVPSPFAGVVSRLYASPGTTVQVGTPILSIEVSDAAEATDAPAPPAVPAAAPERNAVLVGYGPPVEGGARPQRKARAATVRPSSVPEQRGAPASPRAKDRPLSTPPVRKLAADLGVDLATLAGTGHDGTVTRDDVVFASTVAAATAPAERRDENPLEETRIPISGVRKRTAAAMVASAFTAPHATVFLTIDATPTMELIDSLRAQRSNAGHRIGLLAVVAKALTIAVRRTPAVNARWDEAAGEIVQYAGINLGIAAATDRGLMVPAIAHADELALVELADELAALTTAAREGTTTPAALRGGTITITNVGVFGVDAGTPILNPGEAAILAVGAVRRQPWEHRGEIALRDVLTLSLSFDHRLVDGEQGARFLADVGAIIAEPGRALAMV